MVEYDDISTIFDFQLNTPRKSKIIEEQINQANQSSLVSYCDELNQELLNNPSKSLFKADDLLNSLQIKTDITSDRRYSQFKTDQTSVSQNPQIKRHNQADTEVLLIEPWRNKKNFSARIIEVLDKTVIVECLIDKEYRIYEEREFPLVPFFDGIDIVEGNLLLIRYSERKNEMRIEIISGAEFVLPDDFPKSNIKEKFTQSTFFKNKR